MMKMRQKHEKMSEDQVIQICINMAYEMGERVEMMDLFLEDNNPDFKKFTCKEEIELAFQEWHEDKRFNQ